MSAIQKPPFAERVGVQYDATTGIAFIALDGADEAAYFVDVLADEAGTPACLTFTKIRTRETHAVAVEGGAVCSCRGFQYRGQCRHSVAAARLIEENLL